MTESVYPVPRLIRITGYIIATMLVAYALVQLSDRPPEAVVDCGLTNCAHQGSER